MRRQHGRRRVCLSAAPILALATLIPALGLVTDGTAGAATSSCTTYTSPATGSHQVCGAIRTKYLALGGPAGFLGYPVTDELPTPDGIGRFNHFANSGSIYWTPSTGAWSIHGTIRDKWASLGWERGFLGYPVTDETGTPDGIGRFNHFSGSGSIYWTPSTGALSVHGAILGKWASMGWERSCEGYPVSDEFAIQNGRESIFQRGVITYDFGSGQALARCDPAPTLSVNPSDTYKIAQLDGPGSINNTDTRWNVYGADLGHMFLANGQMFMTFGDTFGGPAAFPFFSVSHAGYRRNAMASIDTSAGRPVNGLNFTGMITDSSGAAKELIPAVPGEAGVIPTYGVSVGNRMFLYYMSVKQWGAPGHWTLNNSGIAYSDDGGHTWTRDPAATWPGDSNFGQVSLVHQGSYVYVFGIPGGRYGALRLARVPDNLVQVTAAYEYWNGTSWTTGNPSAAVDIAPSPVGELSVQWSSYYQKWLMTYLVDPNQQVVLRMSDSLTGPWSAPQVIVTDAQYQQLYAPYITPLWNDGPDIYFTMSVFDHYQVYLMHTSLRPATGATPPRTAAPVAPQTTAPSTTSPFEHGRGDTPSP